MNEQTEKWRKGMKAFHAETKRGGNLFEGTIIRYEQGPQSILEGLGGWDEMRAFCIALKLWQERVERGDKMLCLACEHEFLELDKSRADSGVPAVAWFRPFVVGAGRLLIIGVCVACSKRSDEELMEVAYQDLKRMGLAKKKIGFFGQAEH
jgi:hypothetical protein